MAQPDPLAELARLIGKSNPPSGEYVRPWRSRPVIGSPEYDPLASLVAAILEEERNDPARIIHRLEWRW